jgi:putative hemolysin
MRVLAIGMSTVRRFLNLGIALLIGLHISACATIYTDASDSNKVTFLNSTNESRADLQSKAQAYCMQYGKKSSVSRDGWWCGNRF